MTTISISEFKAKCIAILKEAQRSGKPVLITWRGRPMARVEPVAGDAAKRRLGAYRGRMTLRAELVGLDSSGDWEVLG
jgi:prevent-host-death family protein